MATTKRDPESPVIEAETRYSITDLLSSAPGSLGVSPEVVAGALSGCTEPMTIMEVRDRVNQFLHKEVK